MIKLPSRARYISILVMLLSLINAVIELTLVAFIATLITRLLATNSEISSGLSTKILNLFTVNENNLTLELLVSVVLLNFIWRAGFLYYTVIAARNIGAMLSYSIYNNVIYLNNLTKFSLPEITTTITNKVNAIVNGIIITTFTVITSFFTLIFLGIILIISLGFNVIIGFIILIIGYAVFFYFLRIKAERYSEILSNNVVKTSSIIMNIFENRAILLVAGLYRNTQLNKKFKDSDYDAKNAVARIRIYQDLARPVFELIINFTIIVLAMNFDTQPGIGADAVLVVVVLTRLIPYFQNAYRGLITYRGSIGSAKLVLNLLGEGAQAALEYKHIGSKSTTNSQSILLRGESLSINVGEKIIKYPDFRLNASTGLYTITGASGSGKSTLIHAICGLHSYQGKLELQHPETDDPEKIIGLCLQNVWLFKGTVKENLEAFLETKMNKEEISRANNLINETGLQVEKTSRSKPMLERQIGDNGQSLSGGEIKRLGIVRALIRDPKLLIIDEPTSGLDLETANDIGKLLEKLSKQMVVVVISHDQALIARGKLLLRVGDG